MRNYIMGFSQKDLVRLDLDLIDTMILRYFVDFKGSTKMKEFIFEEEVYYWLDYKTVLDDLPILKISSTETIRRRIENLIDANVLIKKTIATKGGRKTYIKLGFNYTSLLLDKNEKPKKDNKKENKKKAESFIQKKLFNTFWKAYPKKVSKGQAETTFNKQVKDEETLDLILADLDKRKRFKQWTENQGQFIPYPSSYLNNQGWLDEYEVEKEFVRMFAIRGEE